MVDGFVKRWGRAAALAVWCSGLATLVMGGVLLLVVAGAVSESTLVAAMPIYMGTMGAIGTATQVPNFAERLPGTRRWEQPPETFDGQTPRQDSTALP